VVPELPEGLLTPADLLAALPAFPGGAGQAVPADPQLPAVLSPVPPATPPAVLPPVPPATPPARQAAPPFIEVEGLGYTYMLGTPLAQRALDNVSLHVAEGQSHGLIGMTGSGKTTLLQHLNLLLRAQEGKVRVAEFDLNDPNVDRRRVVRRVGLVFQNPEMQFFEYYVGDEIAYGPRQLKVEEPLAARVRWAMQNVGLDFDAFKDRPLFTLSGGERRKVALASTLALKPDILLLDEPTAGLDPASRRDLLEKLLAMRAAGLTLVLSSHQMGDLARITRGLTVMYRGQSVLAGPTAEIFEQHKTLEGYSLEPPVATQAADALRTKGWPLAGEIMTAEALQDAVEQAVRGGEG
jgi:energy-coupling factor transport system ATP-binding protein